MTTLATGTMVLSGLTLTVCAAGFLFLSKKLSQIDNRLQEIQKDIKAIRHFLESKETASLQSSLNDLAKVSGSTNQEARRSVLSVAHGKLGEVNARYRRLFESVEDLNEIRGIEEYFVISALGHSRCSAELELSDASINYLEEAWNTWENNAKRIAKTLIFKSSPERFLEPKYARLVKTDELADWLDFANSDNKDLGWIDELRLKPRGLSVPLPGPFFKDQLTKEEILEIETMKRIVSRNRVLQGYIDQSRFLCEQSIKPSDFEKELRAVPADTEDEKCLVFLKNALN